MVSLLRHVSYDVVWSELKLWGDAPQVSPVVQHWRQRVHQRIVVLAVVDVRRRIAVLFECGQSEIKISSIVESIVDDFQGPYPSYDDSDDPKLDPWQSDALQLEVNAVPEGQSVDDSLLDSLILVPVDRNRCGDDMRNICDAWHALREIRSTTNSLAGDR